MKLILIVFMVANARSYNEEPQYVIEFPTEAACLAEAAKYPTKGIFYQKAVCVPKVVKGEAK